MPDFGPAVHTHAVITPDGRTDTDHGERNPFTTVCGDVCQECNTGWMHELEESAKPVLRNLIQGDSRKLKFWRQTLGGTWAVKTAMVWDSVVPRAHTIPRTVLHTLHRTQRLNLRQQVWIGRYVGAQPHHSFRQTAAHVVGPVTGGLDDPNEAHAYIAALSVGQLAFVVYGHVLGVPHPLNLPEALTSKLIDVWPPTQDVLVWPPAETLTDDDLELVVYSLGLPMEPEQATR